MTRPHIARRVAERCAAAGSWPLPHGTFSGLDKKVQHLDMLAKGAARLLEEAHLSHLFVDNENPGWHEDSVREVKQHLASAAEYLAEMSQKAGSAQEEIKHALAKVHAAYP